MTRVGRLVRDMLLAACLLDTVISMPVASKLELIALKRKSRAVASDGEAISFLNSFGWTDRTGNDQELGQSMQQRNTTTSLKEFQIAYGLPATGRLDSATLQLMNKERCGLPDKLKRTKRFSLGETGVSCNGTTITYRVEHLSGNINAAKQTSDIRWAARQWSQYANVDFKEIQAEDAMIHIGFYDGEHTAGHRNASFKSDLEFAHAKKEYLHFNDGINWTETSNKLRVVALHEFGHILGLGHSLSKGNVMYPVYEGFLQLSEDDLNGLRTLCPARETCEPGEFQCPYSKRCIPNSWICDQKSDCLKDNADEAHCNEPQTLTCNSAEYYCRVGEKCIAKSLLCNGQNDCGENEDEEDCPEKSSSALPASTCSNSQFRCTSAPKCISVTYRCDNERDCPGGEDEQECSPSSTTIKTTASTTIGASSGQGTTISNANLGESTTNRICFTIPNASKRMIGGLYSSNPSSFTECQKSCTGDERCNGFMYVPADQDCLLYDTTPESRPEWFVPKDNPGVNWYLKSICSG